MSSETTGQYDPSFDQTSTSTPTQEELLDILDSYRSTVDDLREQ